MVMRATSLAGIDVDHRRLAEICDRYGIDELLVFGSTARGEASPTSDIDLLYSLAEGRHLGFSINRLEDELADLLGRPVDLIAKRSLHRSMRRTVLAEAIRLHGA